MTVLFAALALFCVGYWILMTVYAGHLMAGGFIWFFFALLSLLNFLAAWAYKREWKQISLQLVTTIHTASFALGAIFMVAGVLAVSAMRPKETGNPDYVAVLGAELNDDGSVSKTLKRRLDSAVLLSDRHLGAQLILCGGKTKSTCGTEAEAMAEYLRYNGISATRLILEPDSKNTYENVRNSWALVKEFRGDLSREDKALDRVKPVSRGDIPSVEARPLTFVILSSDFHLFRAIRMAEKESGQKVYGAAVSSDPILFLHYLCRESAAIIKDKFLGRL